MAYSVTEVKSEELNRVKVSNIANSLVGKVAGVNVVKPASGVMGSSRITIRGNGSLNGSNQPLYVIDGVPMNNGGYGQAGEWGGFDAGDGISSINSEDIESMSVLKGELRLHCMARALPTVQSSLLPKRNSRKSQSRIQYVLH